MQKILIIIIAIFFIYPAYSQIDRSKPPKAGPAPVIKIADPVIYKLANGLTVLVVENHKLPKVSATYSIDAGPVTEGEKAGVLNLMGEMLNEGTTVQSKADFDEAVDRIGANVNLYASGGSASALTRYFDQAFLLMAEALKQPAFSVASFEKLKTQTLTGMKANEKSVKAISSRVTNALLYGTHHPNGEMQTEQTINNITLDDVKSAYKKYITPSRGYLTFVGDINPQQAKALAEKAFGGWKGSSLQLEKLAVVSNPAVTEIDVVDVPNAVQSEIKVVNLVNLPLSSPDYFAALLANQVLGGGADSRLFMNLREKHGFTYGAYSSIGSGRFQTAFNATASVRNEKTDSAVGQFLYEIHKMRTGKISKDELENAKALYNGNFALGLENPARIATFASNILINNLPKDFYRTYLQKINAVTVDDIQRVAQKYFNYNNTRIVIAGKADEIRKGLEALNHPVKYFDKYAQPVSAVKSEVNTDAKTIINDYLKAIGGIDELKKIKTLYTKMSMSMQGMELNVETKKMTPNKELATVSMQGNIVSKSLFNGSTGYQEQMGNKVEITGDDLNDKKVQTSIFAQVDYLSNAFKIEVKGIEKLNNNDVYKLIVTKPSGKTQTEYYDVNSKLLVKEEETIHTNNMELLKTIELSEYKKAGNILLPYKQSVSVSSAGQEQAFDMNVTDAKINEAVHVEDFE